MSDSTLNKLMIGLDLTSTDEAIFSFLNQNKPLLKNSSLSFIHVKDENNSSSDSGSANMSLSQIEDYFNSQLEKHLSGKTSNYNLNIIEGDPSEEVVQAALNNDADLLILGHKKSKQHKVKPNKLVEKSRCSLLLVPEDENLKVDKIGVAINFSDLCKQVVAMAAGLAKTLDADLLGVHTFQVPSGYHKTGKDHEEFSEVMEGHAKDDAKEFLNEVGLQGLQMKYIYDEKDSADEYLVRFSKENKLNLFAMGSRGRTDAASVMLGSLAKSLSKKLYEIPLMIVKDKSEKMDLMGAIKEV